MIAAFYLIMVIATPNGKAISNVPMWNEKACQAAVEVVCKHNFMDCYCVKTQ